MIMNDAKWIMGECEMMICDMGQCRYRASPARNASRSGQLLKSGGRSFQSLAVLGKKDDLCALVLE